MTPKPIRIHLMHASLQYSDSVSQKKADTEAIFARAEKRQVLGVTITEAGEDPLKTIAKQAAERHGYTFHQYKSNGVCIRKSAIVPGTYKKGGQTVVENDEVAGPGHDLNYVWAEFDNKNIGHVTIIGSHLATKGRQKTTDPKVKVNTDENKRLATAIGQFAKKQGAGRALVFYGGDQNDNDKFVDTFFGQPLTSIQDELKKYERTHWSTIDVIASYDKDGRVKGAYVRALDDSELKLATDHFLLEAGYDVVPLG